MRTSIAAVWSCTCYFTAVSKCMFVMKSISYDFGICDRFKLFLNWPQAKESWRSVACTPFSNYCCSSVVTVCLVLLIRATHVKGTWSSVSHECLLLTVLAYMHWWRSTSLKSCASTAICGLFDAERSGSAGIRAAASATTLSITFCPMSGACCRRCSWRIPTYCRSRDLTYSWKRRIQEKLGIRTLRLLCLADVASKQLDTGDRLHRGDQAPRSPPKQRRKRRSILLERWQRKTFQFLDKPHEHVVCEYSTLSIHAW